MLWGIASTYYVSCCAGRVWSFSCAASVLGSVVARHQALPGQQAAAAAGAAAVPGICWRGAAAVAAAGRLLWLLAALLRQNQRRRGGLPIHRRILSKGQDRSCRCPGQRRLGGAVVCAPLAAGRWQHAAGCGCGALLGLVGLQRAPQLVVRPPAAHQLLPLAAVLLHPGAQVQHAGRWIPAGGSGWHHLHLRQGVGSGTCGALATAFGGHEC